MDGLRKWCGGDKKGRTGARSEQGEEKKNGGRRARTGRLGLLEVSLNRGQLALARLVDAEESEDLSGANVEDERVVAQLGQAHAHALRRKKVEQDKGRRIRLQLPPERPRDET